MEIEPKQIGGTSPATADVASGTQAGAMTTNTQAGAVTAKKSARCLLLDRSLEGVRWLDGWMDGWIDR